VLPSVSGDVGSAGAGRVAAFPIPSGGAAVTAAEVVELLGRVGSLDLTSDRVPISVRVTVHDVRQVFGRRDYLVEPVAGRGRAWVSSDRVRLD
jgi:hypothetical protein